ncbi:hypothetical protein EGW08_023692 [Elysia chlorotica]|uniref:arylamine N-acetyltransferase n=1 Tax=Elysia chlorotica TaxID=188477 RepID=A0A433SIK7_ELYCH|nr:hypothetical protein EGW08_023692 [Elysia chlorotica]
MSDYCMFTKKEALQFARDRLGVVKLDQRLATDRRGALDDITTAFQTRLPFNNLSLMSAARDDRRVWRRPTLEEIKQDILSGIGGLCFSLNVANFFILKALGFNVLLASATIAGRETHVTVYAQNVERAGDTYLAEASVGYPTFRAICLDCEESPVYRDSFLEYKYMKRDGKLLRLHRHGDLGCWRNVEPVLIDGWRVVYTAQLHGTANVEEFYPKFDKLYVYRLQAKDPLITQFHAVFRLVQSPGNRAVMISNRKLILENENGSLETIPLDGGDEEILAAVRRYFPGIPAEMARRALGNWRCTERYTSP